MNREALIHRRTSRPLLIDGYCCQGGAGKGYYDAGFDVIGVDINPQPRYPFPFIQMDMLEFLRAGMPIMDWRRPAAVHVSPPCQVNLNLTRLNESMGREHDHEDLIAETRELLRATGLPYVIENVMDAKPKLLDPVRVCGTSFGLPLRRHRLFESDLLLVGTQCAHHLFTEPRYWTGWRPKGEHRLSTVVQIYGNAGGREHWPAALEIDWMDAKGMCEAIPPRYTQHIGEQLMAHITGLEAAA